MVAEVLTGLDPVQTFDLAVFAGRHPESGAGDFGGEDGVFPSFADATLLPFPGQFAANGNGTETFFNPGLRIAFGLVKFAGAKTCQLGIFYLFYTLVPNLRQPAFEGFGLRRGNGLDDTEKTLPCWHNR